MALKVSERFKLLCGLSIPFMWHLVRSLDPRVSMLENVRRQVHSSILRPIIHLFLQVRELPPARVSALLRSKQKGLSPGLGDLQWIMQMLPLNLWVASGQSDRGEGRWSSLLWSTHTWVTLWFLYAMQHLWKCCIFWGQSLRFHFKLSCRSCRFKMHPWENVFRLVWMQSGTYCKVNTIHSRVTTSCEDPQNNNWSMVVVLTQ